MKIKAIGLTFILCLSCLLAAGCSDKNGQAAKPAAEKPAAKQETQVNVPVVEKNIYVLPSDGSQNLAAKKMKIKAAKGQEALAALQAVVENNVKSFPKGTKVLGLVVKDGLATINMSKEFLAKGQGEYERTMSLYAIVNTLTEFPDIKKVLFQAEGKKIDVLGQMDMSEPLTRNKTYLPKAK
jgi:germination protein M